MFHSFDLYRTLIQILLFLSQDNSALLWMWCRPGRRWVTTPRADWSSSTSRDRLKSEGKTRRERTKTTCWCSFEQRRSAWGGGGGGTSLRVEPSVSDDVKCSVRQSLGSFCRKDPHRASQGSGCQTVQCKDLSV